MSLFSFGGDKRKGGTHYSGRMTAILGACAAMGVRWQEAKTEYHGQVETFRQELVRQGPEVVLTKQYEKYPLVVNPRVLEKVKRMAPQFALALNIPSVSIEVDGDTVFVRVPRNDGQAEGLTFESAWGIAPDLPPGNLLLGECDDGAQAALDMTGPNVHAAVIGMTGSGKTTLLRTMAMSALCAGGSRVVLCDPAKKGFWPICGHPAVAFGGIFADPGAIEQCLRILAERVRKGEDSGTVYVFVDELPSLMRERPAIGAPMATIAERGRHIDMHLVIGAQHALVSELGASTLRNIPAVLCGKVKDRQAAYTSTGQADTGAETLRGGGDFIAVTAAGVSHFQAAMPSPEELAQWKAEHPPRYGRLPVMAGERKETPQRSPAPIFVRAQSTAPVVTMVTTDDGPVGEIGRPEEMPSTEAIEWVVGQWRAKGEPPTLTAIYNRTKAMYPKIGGYGRPKAQRALDAARAIVEGAR